MSIRTLFAAFAGVAFAASALAAPLIVTPPDVSKNDPGLTALLDTLVKAADARDFAPFEAAMSPEVLGSYGGEGGVQEFRTMYEIDSPDSVFWGEFKEAVALGAVEIEPGLVYAPYLAGTLPEEADPYLSLVAIGEKTQLYAEPKDDAAVVADITHQVVEQLDITPEELAKTPEGWIRVKADAGEGYVKEAEVRSAIDFRAVFEKKDGAWKLAAFVAGD